MADGMLDLKLIPEFESSDRGLPIVEWFEKTDLLCHLCHVKNIITALPLRLTVYAFAVSRQLSKEKRKDVGRIMDALQVASATDPFAALDLFVARRFNGNESVDVYLADLCRLLPLYGGVSG